MNRTQHWLALIGSIVLSQLAGLVGTIYTIPAIPTWYAGLTKTFFNPPSWLFGPVWTTLYTLMGVALYLVWRSPKGKARTYGIAWFMVQLVLNALWSKLFFGLQNPLYGLVGIVFLLVSIIMTIWYFRKVSAPAAWLLAPYILWVSFATLLNASLWYLN